MRSLLIVGLLVVAGCGKKDAGRPTDATPVGDVKADPKVGEGGAGGVTPPAVKKADGPQKAEFDVPFGDIQEAYYDNELKADAKYRDKRGTVLIHEIVDITRSPDGVPVVTTRNFGHTPAPNGYFYFAPGEEAKLADVKKENWGWLKVTGKCGGRQNDGTHRGIDGYEWRVNFTDCRVASYGAPPKK